MFTVAPWSLRTASAWVSPVDYSCGPCFLSEETFVTGAVNGDLCVCSLNGERSVVRSSFRGEVTQLRSAHAVFASGESLFKGGRRILTDRAFPGTSSGTLQLWTHSGDLLRTLRGSNSLYSSDCYH